jgi:hypothetical protein
MWTLVVVEAIAKGAAGVTLEVLKMRHHAIAAGLVRTHSAAALTAAFSCRRIEGQRLLKRDGNPSFPVPKFTRFDNIVQRPPLFYLASLFARPCISKSLRGPAQ